MQQFGTLNGNPALRDLVVEASRALARLDADRLEELALSCQALNRKLALPDSPNPNELSRQATEAEVEMAVFGRVLEVTRANLNVTNRLRALRQNRLEYSESQIRSGAQTEPGHGDN